MRGVLKFLIAGIILSLIFVSVGVSAEMEVGFDNSFREGREFVSLVPPIPPIFDNNTAYVNETERWRTNIGVLEDANSTQFDDGGSNTLNIKESWLTSFGNAIWCALTGCTMAGDIDMNDNNIDNVENITVNNNLFFEDSDHILKKGVSGFVGLGDDAFFFQHIDEQPAGEIPFIVVANKTDSDLDAVLISVQIGLNESNSILGNSWIVVLNNLTNNLTEYHKCFSVAGLLNKTLRVQCDSLDSGADLIVQDDIQSFGTMFADGGIRAETLVDFIMNGEDVNIQNGSVHIFTPVNFVSGVTILDEVTTFAEDFVGLLGSFSNLQIDTGNWFSTTNVLCDDGDCANAIGISGIGNIIMEANISTVNINTTTLNFVYSLANMLGANDFTVTANNNVGSGEVTLLTDSTNDVIKSSQSIAMPSSMSNQPSVSIKFNCDVTQTNRQCFVDTIFVNGTAIATTLTNQSGFNSVIKFGDGALASDGFPERGIIYNASEDQIIFRGNVTFELITEQDLNVTNSITLGGESIFNWDNVSNFDDNVLLIDGSRALIENWNVGNSQINLTNLSTMFLSSSNGIINFLNNNFNGSGNFNTTGTGTFGAIGIDTNAPDRDLEIRNTAPIIRLRATGSYLDDAAPYVEFGGDNAGNWIRTGYVGDAISGDTSIYLRAEVGDLKLGDSSSSSVLTLSGGNVTLAGTGRIYFRDTDIFIGSTLTDGILDINADFSIDMFYDNDDVGNGNDGQSLNINRRAAEGDDYISLHVDKDKKGLIGFSGDDDLLQLVTNALTVNGNLTTTGNITSSFYFGNGSQLTGITHTIDTWALNFTKYYNKTEVDNNFTLFVPYTGATANVNLGSFNLDSTGDITYGTDADSAHTFTGQTNIKGGIKTDPTHGVTLAVSMTIQPDVSGRSFSYMTFGGAVESGANIANYDGVPVTLFVTPGYTNNITNTKVFSATTTLLRPPTTITNSYGYYVGALGGSNIWGYYNNEINANNFMGKDNSRTMWGTTNTDLQISSDGTNPSYNSTGIHTFYNTSGYGGLLADEYRLATPSLNSYAGDYLDLIKSPNEMLDMYGKLKRENLADVEKSVTQIKDYENCWDEIDKYCYNVTEGNEVCEEELPKEIEEYYIIYREECGTKGLNTTNLGGQAFTNRLMISELKEENNLMKVSLCNLGEIQWC